MPATMSPATIVICAGLPQRAETPVGVPVTRVVDLDTLVRRGAVAPGTSVALEIDPAWLTSRQMLRQAVVRARHVAPELESAVLRGPTLAHHAVLAEEGIRVVVVDAFADVGRGSRRPAPAGWPCRNVAWGLWEVRACPPRRAAAWAWLPGLPAPRRGGLHVADVGIESAGRLRRLLDWAARGVAGGRAVAVGLAELPAILEGRRSVPVGASVLKAA